MRLTRIKYYSTLINNQLNLTAAQIIKIKPKNND